MSSLRRTLERILVLRMSPKVKADKVNRRRSRKPRERRSGMWVVAPCCHRQKIGLHTGLPPMEEFRGGVERSSRCGIVMSISGSSLLTSSQPRTPSRLDLFVPALVTPLLQTPQRQRLHTPAPLRCVVKYLVRMFLICNPLQTYNGRIAVDEDGNPCGTVLESAHFAGYKTGLVVTSRLTVSHPCLVSYPPLTALSSMPRPPALPPTSMTVTKSGPLLSSSLAIPLLDLW